MCGFIIFMKAIWRESRWNVYDQSIPLVFLWEVIHHDRFAYQWLNAATSKFGAEITFSNEELQKFPRHAALLLTNEKQTFIMLITCNLSI